MKRDTNCKIKIITNNSILICKKYWEIFEISEKIVKVT